MEIQIVDNLHLDVIGTALIICYFIVVAYFESKRKRVDLYTIDNKLDSLEESNSHIIELLSK